MITESKIAQKSCKSKSGGIKLKSRPTVDSPRDREHDEFSLPVGDAIGMKSDEVLACDRGERAMTASHIGDTIGGEERRAAALGHINAILVEERALDIPAASDDYTIVALGATAAEIERGEEIEKFAVLD